VVCGAASTAVTVTELREKIGKTCAYALLVVMLATGVAALASSSGFALAQQPQQPCQVQLGYPNVQTQAYYYYGNIFQLTLPVSASCPFYAGQLYAAGSAYDTAYGMNVGTAQTVLSSTYAGYGYTGQLTFTMPTSVAGRSVQFSVFIYGSQNGYYGGYNGGPPLAQAWSTFTIPSTYYQGYPSYPSLPSYPSYPYYPGYYYGPNFSYYYYPYCRSWNYNGYWNHNDYCYWPRR